jgi:glucan biosynthesis protein C
MIKQGRLSFFDNIRWLIIVFVVMVHSAVTYSNIGGWYYYEPVKLDFPSFIIFWIFLTFTQAYFMGLLFLIAGYFVPGSLDRKGWAGFLKGRAARLGIPTLLYMLLINPAIDYYLLAFQWTGPRPPVDMYFMTYIQSLHFLSCSGPMWFALALLIFSAVYAVYRHFQGQQKQNLEGKLPGNLAVAGLVLLISTGAFAIRLIQPIGTEIANMQLCFFSSYIILFIAGIIAYRNNWLLRIPYSFGMMWFRAALVIGTVFWMAIMILGGGLSGDLSKYVGGLYWQSAAYALWEAFFCVGACLGLIVLFRDRLKLQGRLAKFMSDNSFSVYLFHPPILILVTLALKEFAWHPIIKFIVASAIVVPLCFMASHFIFRRIPLLKRVL